MKQTAAVQIADDGLPVDSVCEDMTANGSSVLEITACDDPNSWDVPLLTK